MIDIERLRALEKKLTEEASNARDTFKHGGGEYYDGRRDAFNLAASELASLIAELGQEVGVDWSDWFETWAKTRGMTMQLTEDGRFLCPDTAMAQEAHEAGCMASHMYYMELCRQEEQAKTSPAHTSEARDAARYRALKTHFQAKFHRATCDYWVIVGELKTDPRFIGEDGEQLTLDNALDAAIAAMRQEGE